jgi:transcription elongation factor Elf1
MVRIECLVCRKNLKIPKSVNTKNYSGQIVCRQCKSLLYIKLVKEKVERYKVVEKFKPEGKPIRIIEVRNQNPKHPRPFMEIVKKNR